MLTVLEDAIPAKYRKLVYVLMALASLVVSAWTASNGDWNVFIGGLLSTIVNTLAASNVPKGQ